MFETGETAVLSAQRVYWETKLIGRLCQECLIHQASSGGWEQVCMCGG